MIMYLQGIEAIFQNKSSFIEGLFFYMTFYTYQANMLGIFLSLNRGGGVSESFNSYKIDQSILR